MTRPIAANDCFVTDAVIGSARNLLAGLPLTPINFADLCTLIEATVLHERVITSYPNVADTPLQALVDEDVLSGVISQGMAATPEDQDLLLRTFKQNLSVYTEGSLFGYGSWVMPASGREMIRADYERLGLAAALLDMTVGAGAVDPHELEASEVAQQYGHFVKYADSVFDAAAAFGLHAYAACSELPYAITRTAKSVPRRLYDKLSELHREKVNAAVAAIAYSRVDIPPFPAIVLGRCKTRDDIVPELMRARDEFGSFRAVCSIFAKRLREATVSGTANDIIDLHNALESGLTRLTARISEPRNEPLLIYRVWNVVKASTLMGIVVNALDALVEYDIDRRKLALSNALFDVWSRTPADTSYGRVLASGPFSNEFRASIFESFEAYVRQVRAALPVGAASEGEPR